MNYSTTNPLPALIKYFRKKAGLTQAEVAESLSISRSGYANYEEGLNIPNIEQTIKLSELLNHDLLYAYTISSRYMQEHAEMAHQMVMESNSYLSTIESNDNAADLITNYASLSKDDRRLVDAFVKNLCDKDAFV